eukprot:759262-Hanusia_phi.AAC.1
MVSIRGKGSYKTFWLDVPLLHFNPPDSYWRSVLQSCSSPPLAFASPPLSEVARSSSSKMGFGEQGEEERRRQDEARSSQELAAGSLLVRRRGERGEGGGGGAQDGEVGGKGPGAGTRRRILVVLLSFSVTPPPSAQCRVNGHIC